MAPQIQTQEWSKQDIIDTVTLLANKRYGMTLREFVDAKNDGRLDPCEDGDLIALVNLLSDEDELVAA